MFRSTVTGKSTTALALVCVLGLAGCVVPRSANAQWIEAQNWAPAPNWMPVPEVRPLEVPPLIPTPRPAIVYPPGPGPRACETVCRPTRDGGSRCTNVCYGG